MLSAVDRAARRRDSMHPQLVAGGTMPDLELTDHRHQRVTLSAVAKGFPLIVTFYRGYW
jgi:peroxiredoxin